MQKTFEKKFDFDDIVIIPETVTEINSRSEIDIRDENGLLPIITAPMDTVISAHNMYHFSLNGFYCCLPRCESRKSFTTSKTLFKSFSLDEADSLSYILSDERQYICIDIANGHMPKLRTIINRMKVNRPNVNLIVGNIANPDTFMELATLGVWGVRVGIGAGAGCTTSANTGVHYPYGSLIHECYDYKVRSGLKTKIIADGGIKKFADIIKALALGADLVMIGSVFNKSIQSSAPAYLWKLFRVRSQSTLRWLLKKKFSIYKKYRGMSTKEVHKKWGNSKLKTAEGIVRWNKIEYDLYKWTENFTDYLKSSMSYANAKNLEEFKNCKMVSLTPAAFNRFNK